MDLPDLSLTRIISLSATVLLLTYFWFSRRNPEHPPCPLRPWPIFGNLFQLNSDPREQFAGFRKQCGDIYSLYMGRKHVIVLCGLDVVKDALVKHAEVFSNRSKIALDFITGDFNKGLFSSNGQVWKESRAVSKFALRNRGLGSNIIADKIQEEVGHFVKLLESFKGEPVDIHTFTTVSVSNITCSLMAGQRYEYDDKEFQRLQEILKFNLTQLQSVGKYLYFPWLRKLPGDLFYFKVMRKNFHEFYDIFARVHVKENEDVVDEPGNLIAAYLHEIRRRESAGEKTSLDKDNLLRLILDLFMAGTETTSNTLLWVFLYMVNYPDVQEKIFLELKQVVGLERSPCMQDKANLVYLNATIMEIQRLASLVFVSFPRVASRDVHLGGYQIRRGSKVVVDYDSLLLSSSLWGDNADLFRPERFISVDGSLRSPEAWVPYSIGRRACVGQHIAVMELFLYVANILHSFQLVPEDLENIPPLKGTLGSTHTPLSYNLKFVPRRP